MWKICIYRVLIYFSLSALCFGAGFDPDLWDEHNTYGTQMRVTMLDYRGNAFSQYLGVTERRLLDLCYAIHERGAKIYPASRKFTHGKYDFVCELKSVLKHICGNFVKVSLLNEDSIGDNYKEYLYYNPSALLYECNLPTNYFDYTPQKGWETDQTYSYFRIPEILSKLICKTKTDTRGFPGSQSIKKILTSSPYIHQYAESGIRVTTIDGGAPSTNYTISPVETSNSVGSITVIDSNYEVTGADGANSWTASFAAKYRGYVYTENQTRSGEYYSAGKLYSRTEDYSLLDIYKKFYELQYEKYRIDLLPSGICSYDVFNNKKSGICRFKLYHIYQYLLGEYEEFNYTVGWSGQYFAPYSTNYVNPYQEQCHHTTTRTTYGYDSLPKTGLIRNSYTNIATEHEVSETKYTVVTDWYATDVYPGADTQTFYLNREPPYTQESADSVGFQTIQADHGYSFNSSGYACEDILPEYTQSKELSYVNYDIYPTESIGLQLVGVILMIRYDQEGGYTYY